MKLMLATDMDLAKIKFPMIGMCKIDGVRGANIEGVLRGRSLKCHKNRYTTSFFSEFYFEGFDGELYVGENSAHPDLCRLTSSALGTYEGEPNINWAVFDYFGGGAIKEPYSVRLQMLKDYYSTALGLEKFSKVKLVNYWTITSIEELEKFEDWALQEGFEGVILRSPDGMYKQGRATVRENTYLRGKRFIESEAIVDTFEEGSTNLNEAQINERGLQFRSSHKENKIPNGRIGVMYCKLTQDIIDPITKAKLFSKDEIVKVSPGKMTHEESEFYFKNPEKILGRLIKWKFFPRGMKDEPRFPNFQSFRLDTDI